MSPVISPKTTVFHEIFNKLLQMKIFDIYKNDIYDDIFHLKPYLDTL